MTIKRKNNIYEVEQLKHCSTSLGYNIYVFRRCGNYGLADPFIVAAKNSLDETCDFVHCLTMKQAFAYYLDLVCCYV